MTHYVSTSGRISLLLERAEAAIYENDIEEARRLLKAVLRSDPTNDQALLMLIYAAEDGEQSLRYLAQLLEVHPRHPDARHAIRWVQKRVPTSALGRSAASPAVIKTRGRTGQTVIGLALVVAALFVGLLWQLVKPPTIPAAPQVAQPDSDAITATPDLEPYMKIIKVVIPMFTPTPTATPTPTPTPTPIPSNAWVPVAGQPQTYNLSCESRSAVDLAGYWGVTIGELDFLDLLGLSDNPHSGFVGDVTMPPGSMPPYGYGVYAEPVASTLQGQGLDAHAVYDLGLDALKAELVAGRPVMVWATYGMDLFEPYEWTSRDGRISTVVPFMHTFIVTGFDETYIVVLDAYDATIQRYPNDTFLQAWSLFDQMAVTASGPLQ
jgi:uncharacterized protein YvpB